MPHIDLSHATRPLGRPKPDTLHEKLWRRRDWVELKHDLLEVLLKHDEKVLARRLERVEHNYD